MQEPSSSSLPQNDSGEFEELTEETYTISTDTTTEGDAVDEETISNRLQDFRVSEREEEEDAESSVNSEVVQACDLKWDANYMRLLSKELEERVRFELHHDFENDTTKITNFDQNFVLLECDFRGKEVMDFICHILGVEGEVDEDMNPVIHGNHRKEDIKEAFFRFYRKLFCNHCYQHR